MVCLGDRISGRILLGAVSGRPKYLTVEEEKELVGFIVRCTQIGYSKSRLEFWLWCKGFWLLKALMLL